jgi:hypothetical protein
MVAPVCDSSYLGGTDREDLSSRSAQAKSPTIKAGCGVHLWSHNPSYEGGISRTEVQAAPQEKNARPYLNNN